MINYNGTRVNCIWFLFDLELKNTANSAIANVICREVETQRVQARSLQNFSGLFKIKIKVEMITRDSDMGKRILDDIDDTICRIHNTF